jgi:hypothetical protein
MDRDLLRQMAPAVYGVAIVIAFLIDAGLAIGVIIVGATLLGVLYVLADR